MICASCVGLVATSSSNDDGVDKCGCCAGAAGEPDGRGRDWGEGVDEVLVARHLAVVARAGEAGHDLLIRDGPPLAANLGLEIWAGCPVAAIPKMLSFNILDSDDGDRRRERVADRLWIDATTADVRVV